MMFICQLVSLASVGLPRQAAPTDGDDQLLPDAAFDRVSSLCEVVQAVQVPQVTTPRKCAHLSHVSALHKEPVCSKEVLWNSGESKREYVRALMEKGTLKTVRERRVKFVLSADSSLGKLHIMKNAFAVPGRVTCQEGSRLRRRLATSSSATARLSRLVLLESD